MRNLQTLTMALLGGVMAVSSNICSEDYLQNCSDPLYVMTKEDRRSVVPEGKEAMVAHCEKQKEAEKCLRERADVCDTGFTKGLSRVLFDDNHEEFSRRCDPSSKENKDFLSVAPCLNTIGSELYKCVADMTAPLNSLPKLKTFREKVDRGCCMYQKFEKCALEVAADRCGSEARAFLDGYLAQTVREAVTLLCSTDSSVCNALKSFDVDERDHDEPRNIFTAIHFMLSEIQRRP